jgi:hypothetical protein
MRVAVIGAGTAGLAAAQALAARGLDAVVYEAGSQLGGNWRWDNDSGFSSGYRSLRANTSRQHTAFRCFPLPRGGPLFLSNAAMLEYLERFADHFDLRRHIRFGSRVTSARPSNGGWAVEVGSRSEEFSAVLARARIRRGKRQHSLADNWEDRLNFTPVQAECRCTGVKMVSRQVQRVGVALEKPGALPQLVGETSGSKLSTFPLVLIDGMQDGSSPG